MRNRERLLELLDKIDDKMEIRKDYQVSVEDAKWALDKAESDMEDAKADLEDVNRELDDLREEVDEIVNQLTADKDGDQPNLAGSYYNSPAFRGPSLDSYEFDRT